MDKKSKPWYYSLDWKHYAAAGVVVAILISLLLLRAVNQEEQTIDEPSPDNVDVPTASVPEGSPGIGDPIGGFISGISFGSSWTWLFMLVIPMIVVFYIMGHRNLGMVIAFIIPLVIIIPMFYSITGKITAASNASGSPMSGTVSTILSMSPILMVLGVIVAAVVIATGLFGRD